MILAFRFDLFTSFRITFNSLSQFVDSSEPSELMYINNTNNGKIILQLNINILFYVCGFTFVSYFI